MVNSMRRAFTVIELMITVTIIVIISSFAITSYRNYTVRSRVAEAYSVMAVVKNEIVRQYELQNAWPSSIVLGNTTISAATDTVFTAGSVAAVFYTTGTFGLEVYVKMSALNGVHPNYVDPVAAPIAPGEYSQVYLVTLLNSSSGTFTDFCGQWSSVDTTGVPAEFLPTRCLCTNLEAVFTAGDTTSCQ